MNIRRLSLCAVIGLTCMGMYAVPAKRGTRTFTMADGSTISLNLVGDERSHTLCTTDGMAVDKGADGFYYYRNTEGLTSVRAHDPMMRNAAERSFVAASSAELSAARQMQVKSRKAAARRANAGPRKATQVPNNGAPRVPVILVQYKDYKFKDADANATFKSFFSEGSTSAYQYFVDQSNGMYKPQFDVYGPYTLSGNRTTYGGNDYYTGEDKGVGKMVAEGCQGLNQSIDFSRYDNDGDGECDVVIVLYAGDGEASSYEDDCEDAVWPCQWELSSSDYGKSLTLDGTKVDKFAVFNELNGKDLSRIDGIGTVCHEFSHCLGLPDFYDTNYGPHFGMANWSLMDYGSYNDEGYTPIGYSAYEKAFMGWIELEEASENTYYTLPVFNQKNKATDKAVKITNPKDANEYYVLENRANQGWDKYMPAEGLMISHVTYSASSWASNNVNDYDMQRMTPIPADNSLKMITEYYEGEAYYIVDEDDLAGDLWPYGDATELTDTSVPAAKVNTGSYMGKPVTGIQKNADGTISFWTMKAKLPAVAMPIVGQHNVNSTSSVTLNWQAGDNTAVTYTVEIKEHRDITYELIESADFSNENHGWLDEGYTVVEDGYTRMGSGKQQGALTSGQLKASDDGIVTIRFKAKSYGTDDSSVKVSLLDTSNGDIASETVQLTSKEAEYVVKLQAKANAAFKVEFATVAKKKRICMKQADIYTGDATELVKAPARAAAENGDAKQRTITGITTTSYTVENLAEGLTYDYRIKAVPVDTDVNDESAWTEVHTVNLSDNSGIADVEAADEAGAEYYTLQGVRVDGTELPAGIYLRRCGNHVEKIVVR